MVIQIVTVIQRGTGEKLPSYQDLKARPCFQDLRVQLDRSFIKPPRNPPGRSGVKVELPMHSAGMAFPHPDDQR